ncbi:MAG: DEAD/DEAH box helicase [Oscillospiraceae bacterium]|jgi:ATP-dependent Lhr-like helicase|nr:DEAD/DEAH box helicase [Oscillospiraceae bacterium]
MNLFDRLPPYMQDYIYREGWTELRQVQVAACRAVFETDSHLLLSAGTAAGKTEAAFLPALTLLWERPSESVGILYISPLKALINDQFVRLSGLLEQGGVPVCKWHGDASGAAKERLVREPAGVLQITPESLEGLLTNRRRDVPRLFRDLRFAVIDEVHYFMAGDRGIQLLCLLERLERAAGCEPRRIGLSATVGDPAAARDWLRAGTARDCLCPDVPDVKRRLRVAMHRFVKDDPGAGETLPREEEYYRYLYEQSLGKKTILFATARAEVETAVAHLRKMAAGRHTPDVYRVHHGSISAALREETEREMKRDERPLVTGATVTLELGIDIGDLDRVIQLGAPLTVSSLVQRVGRCGRKGQTAELLFVLREDDPALAPDPLAVINWDFLKAVAVLQLYLERRWTEPIRPRRHPYGLLYHQTMSHLLAQGEASPPALAQAILTLFPFRDVTREDYRLLLRHLLDIGHLQRSERGGLLIGPQAEPVVTGYAFPAVFETPVEYQVRHKGETLGSVMEAYPAGTRFALAGRSWRVTDCSEKARILSVVPAEGISRAAWMSLAEGELHRTLAEAMRDVLREDRQYAYLSPGCRERLTQMREAARRLGILDRWVLPLDGASQTGDAQDSFAVFPWLGTPQLRTLQLALQQRGIDAILCPGGFVPLYLELRHRAGAADLRREIREILREGVTVGGLPIDGKMRLPSKFAAFLPPGLVRKQLREDYLDPALPARAEL